MSRRLINTSLKTTLPASRPIISRPELPIVQRGDSAGSALRVLVLVLLVLAAVFYGPKYLKFDSISFTGEYRIDSVAVDVQSTGKLTTWLVTGMVINQSAAEKPAPDLEVRLVRNDGSLVTRSVLPQYSQAIPANGGLRFQTRLTGTGTDPVIADIRLIKPARTESTGPTP